MAPPRADGPPGGPDGSPPGAAAPRQSAVSHRGRAVGSPGAAPSDVECSSAPRQGRSSGAVAPHHPTPPAPLPAAPPTQTVGPLSTPEASNAQGEARSAPPDGGEAVAGPGTPGLGTAERGAHADQPCDH